MDAEETMINSKQTFRRNAAWFSFLIPLGSTLIGCSLLKFANNISTSGAIFYIAVFLLIQIVSLAAGIFGIFSKANSIKIVSLIGVLMSCVIGFFAFLGLLVNFSGICG